MTNKILIFILSLVVLTLTACSPPVHFSSTRGPAVVDPTQNVLGMSYLPNKPLPEVWTNCAQEDGVCYFEGIKQVRFGVPGAYITKNFFESANCSLQNFGGDPAYGSFKACDVEENHTMDTFEPLPISQQVAGTMDLDIANFSDKGNYLAEAQGVPFNWGAAANGRSYVEWSVQVQSAGVYDVQLLFATDQSSTGFELLVDTVNLGSVPVPSTGGFTTYSNATISSVPLSAGVHRFRIHKIAFNSINLAGVKLIKN